MFFCCACAFPDNAREYISQIRSKKKDTLVRLMQSFCDCSQNNKVNDHGPTVNVGFIQSDDAESRERGRSTWPWSEFVPTKSKKGTVGG